MPDNKSYAILDTDFVSKANIIQMDSDHVLADLVLDFPDYQFYCHEMMAEELSRHGTHPAQNWLQSKLTSGIIKQYSDKDILVMLEGEVGGQCYNLYLNFLKTSCDIYGSGYFERMYASIIHLVDEGVSQQAFLAELRNCDVNIGPHQSLGEKKAYVLLQALQFIKGGQVYLFCSDDFGARKALADNAGIPCISIIAVFMKLKNMGISKEDSSLYFQSYVAWCSHNGQTQLRVWEHHGTDRRVKRDLLAVFDGLYRDEFELLQNGDLRIITKSNE